MREAKTIQKRRKQPEAEDMKPQTNHDETRKRTKEIDGGEDKDRKVIKRKRGKGNERKQTRPNNKDAA